MADVRLGQLIKNTMAMEAGRPVKEDVYDLEDANLEEWIDRWLERSAKRR